MKKTSFTEARIFKYYVMAALYLTVASMAHGSPGFSASSNAGPVPQPSFSYVVPVSVQANSSSLWIVGGPGPSDQQNGMMPGTSPSTTVLRNGGVVTAFQANTGNLFTTGVGGLKDWGWE